MNVTIEEESDSGPFHTLGKRTGVSPRGFESRLLRHIRNCVAISTLLKSLNLQSKFITLRI